MSDTALVEAQAPRPLAVVEKMCSRCRVKKPLVDFHAEPRQADGRRSVCKQCRCEQEAVRRESRGDAIRAQQREYYQRTKDVQCRYQREYRRANRAKLRAYFREYRKRHPEIVRAGRERWNAANPGKRAAHSALWNAIHRGDIVPPAQCENDACRAVGYVEAHHDDYAKPLSVRWLCELCHVQADEARRRRES